MFRIPLFFRLQTITGKSSAVIVPRQIAGFGLALLLVLSLASVPGCRSAEQVKTAPPVAAKKKLGPAYLGVIYMDIGYGLRVVRVIPRSPAERAGIKGGDLIQAADGESVIGRSKRHFHSLVRRKGAGRAITLQIDRAGRRHDFEVELEERPSDFASELMQR